MEKKKSLQDETQKKRDFYSKPEKDKEKRKVEMYDMCYIKM
jgi:hypothetical protein